ncbi:MAG: hypothetical protein GY797_33845 [Deltaproteobacteria bacterium]|nr:hypothetical protein [Deltaproteobacteria bacterium]
MSGLFTGEKGGIHSNEGGGKRSNPYRIPNRLSLVFESNAIAIRLLRAIGRYAERTSEEECIRI